MNVRQLKQLPVRRPSAPAGIVGTVRNAENVLAKASTDAFLVRKVTRDGATVSLTTLMGGMIGGTCGAVLGMAGAMFDPTQTGTFLALGSAAGAGLGGGIPGVVGT